MDVKHHVYLLTIICTYGYICVSMKATCLCTNSYRAHTKSCSNGNPLVFFLCSLAGGSVGEGGGGDFRDITFCVSHMIYT